jgi:hypothetical protein
MKKVLVIAYYWPPAGGPGVQRWLKFLTYLPEYDISPILYIPENPHYPIIDKTLLKEVPDNLKIYRLPISEPYGWAGIFSKKKTARISSGIIQKEQKQSLLEKLLLWVRGNFFIPDARRSWVRPSISFLREVIEKEQVDTIITTGPPHSLHLIGLGLKEELDLRWIADFRDPWTNIGYHKKLKLTPASKRKHELLEKKVLQKANHIVVTSFTTQAEFKQKTETPISVITNGHDLEPAKEKVSLDEKFTLCHTGSLLSGRNPRNLWKVLSELNVEIKGFREDFELQLAGVVSEEIMEDIDRYGLSKQTKISGYVNHTQAVAMQQRSQILLLVEINAKETKGIIPGKLFEYLASKRPIIAIGPKDWDVSKIIKETRSGNVYGHDDHSDLKNLILNYYSSYKKGRLEVLSEDPKRFSRRELTKKLAEII